MLFAYQQRLDPLAETVPSSAILSTILAALPVLLLFWLLVPRRWLAPKAGAAGAAAAIVIAVLVYAMPWQQACMAFVHGSAFGLLPVGWTIFNAMLIYNITVETGQFTIVRQSVAHLSGDARIQAVLIGFAFGAFMEGAAGAGTPVAICGAILVGLGFDPFRAAVICLIANTSPVAFGGLGTPLIVLGGVTGLPTETLSIMAGHQLPIVSLIVPVYMVKCMCSWRETLEIWPVLLVGGASFALFQFTFATIHAYLPGIVLYPMTDIGGGIFSLVITGVFLRFSAWGRALSRKRQAEPSVGLTPKRVIFAWMPFVLMSLFLVLTGLVRQQEDRYAKAQPGSGPLRVVGPIYTSYKIAIPWLHDEAYRDPRLHETQTPHPEPALFNFAWLTSPGTPVFLASIASIFLLRMNVRQVVSVLGRTCRQMRVPIPTIVFMLGLSYVTRYSGMDATLGYAFAGTGVMYPFFAAFLGWLGVFLTGTDAGSNALFGSLQKISATAIWNSPDSLLGVGSLDQAQVLLCTANSTGGVMGKMIDAQSICVATAATHQIGREADIFKAVVWHSIILTSIIGVITMLQAYVYPFTLMVPAVKM